jgi:large subunit ribosomal protein L19
MDKYIRSIENDYARDDLPELRSGDAVRVNVKVKEGNKERTQSFEGVVIRIKGSGVHKTLTVRRIGALGIGVERVFPVSSPSVEGIVRLRRGKVRRSKLYYLRNIKGKMRIKQKRG